MSLSPESFDEWFLDFAYSPEGSTLVRRVGGRFGLAAAAVDDLHQEWVLAVRHTFANRAAGLAGEPDFVDVESAVRYVAAALKNKAIDLLRKERRTPDPVDVGSTSTPARWDNVPLTVGYPPRGAEALAVEHEWCETAREEITNVLHGSGLRCPGCPAPRVAQIALYAINVWCDRPAHEPLPAWAADIQGGTRELDELVYQALVQIFPDQLDRGDDGRFGASTRKMKQRCGECVRELLGHVALRCHSVMTGDALSDMDSLDHG